MSSRRSPPTLSVEPVAGSFNGVVVGEVVECGQHPNADKLRVTKVNVGGSIPSDGSPRSFAALILKSPGSTAPMVATATFSP
jgi:tRNA-binding EMAP/Myf-like protein